MYIIHLPCFLIEVNNIHYLFGELCYFHSVKAKKIPRRLVAGGFGGKKNHNRRHL